jgi:hypothetical protein
MAQMKTYTFAAAASPANVDINVGFDVAAVEVYNISGQGSSANPGVVKRAHWDDTMTNGYALLVKNTDGAATDASSVITSAGISMLESGALFGSAISAFTNANPGVITVADAAGAGFTAGDTIKVAELADDLSGTSLNGTYVIASVSGNNLTLTTSTAARSVYVSGGNATRVTNAAGSPIATVNRGARYLRIGTGVQAASATISVIMHGKMNVT